MAGTNKRYSPRDAGGAVGRRGDTHRRGAVRHDEAVIQAEVRRLARVLRPLGVLRRDALVRAAGSMQSQKSGSVGALSAAEGLERSRGCRRASTGTLTSTWTHAQMTWGSVGVWPVHRSSYS